MGWPGLKRQVAVALFGIAASCGAQAQITKCLDMQGNVTYTDAAEGTCRNAIIVDIAQTAPAAASVLPTAGSVESVTARTAMLLMTGIDMPVARQSGWANLPEPRKHTSSDAQTVSTARQALADTDRALAAMRTQKLASSR